MARSCICLTSNLLRYSLLSINIYHHSVAKMALMLPPDGQNFRQASSWLWTPDLPFLRAFTLENLWLYILSLLPLRRKALKKLLASFTTQEYLPQRPGSQPLICNHQERESISISQSLWEDGSLPSIWMSISKHRRPNHKGRIPANSEITQCAWHI